MQVKYEKRKDKISPSQADDIRVKYNTGSYTHAELADEYGVAPQTIGQIIRGLIHRSTLTDKNGWPINDQGELNRKLKIKVNMMEKQIKILQYQVYSLRKRLDFPVSEQAPELPDVVNKRYVGGVDTHSKEWIDFWESEEGQELLTESSEFQPEDEPHD